MNSKNIGRNDPCPCGSGKKYKQCCSKATSTPSYNSTLDITNALKDGQKKQEAGNLSDAVTCYQKILFADPKHAEALYYLGQLHTNLGEYQAAISYFLKGIKHEPSAKMYCGLADAFIAIQQTSKAYQCYKKAIELNPGEPLAYNNLGAFLLQQKQYGEAETCLKKAISLNKNFTAPLTNLSSICLLLGKYEEAVSLIKQAISINPSPNNFFKLLYALCFDKNLFSSLYLEEAKRLESVLLHNVIPYSNSKQITSAEKKTLLRIGFVSGDLRIHPVSHFLESTLKELQKSNSVCLIAYYTQHYEDKKSDELKKLFHNWCNIASLSPNFAAKKIHEDSIDILIDLSGYTAKTGIEIFAWHPAKIQVSWLGYFASTGVSFIDYFLADPISAPTSSFSQFTETVWHLPHTRLCFSPPAEEELLPITRLPALENGYITFGCFQNINKISNEAIQLWAKILGECKNSRLLIKNTAIKDQLIRQELIRRFNSYNITEKQLSFEEDQPRLEYLRAYNKIDIMLDTFPFPGGTTTSEALWMGVPTLTLTGKTLLERQGHALLYNSDLPDWVATNFDEYVQKAICFANNLNYLDTLRQRLRNQVKNSPLMNAPLFAKNLEATFWKMWDTHQSITSQTLN